MLELLQIQNLAIISDLTIDLRAGLNVITGETGAGKSILLEALGLVLGERASSEAVRTGCERATLQAIFDIGDDERVASYLEGAGVDAPEDGRLILRREVSAQGKSRCQINQQWVGVQTLARLGDLIVDFHGQHQHQSLLRPEEQLLIVDACLAGGGRGGKKAGVLENYIKAWEAYRDLKSACESADADDRERVRRLDLLRYELEEIREAAPEPGEFERLEADLRKLANAEKLQRLTSDAYLDLYEGASEDEAISARLGRLEHSLEEVAAMDPEAAPLLESVRGARLALDEAAYGLRDYGDAIESDGKRLEETQDRLDLLRKLRRKYGESEEEILALADSHAREIEAADNRDAERERSQKELAAAKKKLDKNAAELSRARRDAGGKLAKAVERELRELNMKGTTLRVAFAPLSKPGPHGAESAEFLLAANVGEEPRPLRKVASGGELSRIMLALKTVDARRRRLPTMVFDEIDAGIGGVAAERVGDKLTALAARQQILCITHLPTIAALGDNHLHVSKQTRTKRTESRVETLNGEARLQELARMIGGEKAGKESLAAAKAMLAGNK